MRFTRWSTFIIACVYSLIGIGIMASGESAAYLRLVDDVGAMYINQPLVGFFISFFAISGLVALFASWGSSRSDNKSGETNGMRWGVGFTAAAIIGFGLFGLALISSAGQVSCGLFFGGGQCQQAKDGLDTSGRVALIFSIVTMIYLVIVLLVSHLGGQRTPIVIHPAPPPPQPPAVDSDLPTQLEKLGEMRQRGDLTDQEFDAAKRRLLGKTGE